jgi:hypothetical protein
VLEKKKFYKNIFFYFLKVSWLRRDSASDVPVLLTFGQTVYVSDVRFSIRRSNSDDWILDILHAKSDDEGIYECQVSTEPSQIHKIYLAVEGKQYLFSRQV